MNFRVFLQNPFTLLFLIWLIVGAVLHFSYEKEELHLTINAAHQPTADSFFIYFTDVGDGLFATIIILVILLFSRKKALQTGAAVITASVITQLLKKIVYADAPRPYKFFGNGKGLHLVDGLQMHSEFSFPSGHATSAFALFMCLALITRNKMIQGLFFLFALTAAFSRVYLSQHFFEDIYAGSIIGFLSGYLMYTLLESRIPAKLDSPFKFLRRK